MIHCEIKVYKPFDGVFKSGSTVSGVLKYTLDEECVFSKITVSFKGNGYLIVKYKQRENNLYTHRKSEEYVDIDYVIHFNQNGDKLLAKSYETQFSFTLPQALPQSLKYSKTNTKYFIQCYVQYYIRIKFERPGLKFPKKFRKEIPIVSVLTARLPTELTIYGEKTIITQFFSHKKGIVDTKASITKSVTVPSEKVYFECEIKNDTKHTIRGITIKLVEVYTFKPKGNREITICENMKDTIMRKSGISIGDVKHLSLEITIPSNISSVENSNLVTREYFVVVSAHLRQNTHTLLKIPIQVGDEIQGTDNNDLLPTYWEVMLEQDEFYQQRMNTNESSDESNG